MHYYSSQISTSRKLIHPSFFLSQLTGRAFPVWLGTGFGLGSAWTDCERSFNPVAIPGVRILPSPNSPNAPSPGQPSVLERLSEKTSGLVEKSKDLAQDATQKGKEVAQDAKQKGKEVSKDLEEKVRKV